MYITEKKSINMNSKAKFIITNNKINTIEVGPIKKKGEKCSIFFSSLLSILT